MTSLPAKLSRILPVALLFIPLALMSAGLKMERIIMIPGGFSAGDEPEGSGKNLLLN